MPNTQIDGSFKTFSAGEALEAYRRVKLDTSSNTIKYADADETGIGVTQDKVAAGDQCRVKLWNSAGSFIIESAAAITALATVYGTADGKVDDATGNGVKIGVANEAASGAAEMIEILREETAIIKQSHVADPAAMASQTQDALTNNLTPTADTTLEDVNTDGTLEALTLTNMDDGSADNTLVAIGDTSSTNESANIEVNFDKIGDEVNALRTAAGKLENNQADIAAQLAKVKTDVAAAKTAIDANNAAIDSILATLEANGMHADS